MNRAAPSRRPWAPLVYGTLDLVLALLYAWLVLAVLPTRSTWIKVFAIAVSAALAAGGVGMLSSSRIGRRVAAASAVVMLVVCLLLITLLVASAAYLHGIYGGIGQAGTAVALVAAALAFELVGLLPALQLGYLWRTRQR